MPSAPSFTILAIDDDPALLRSLQRILSATCYRLITCDQPEQALPVMEREQIALVLLDLQMPRVSGMSLLTDIASLYPDVPVIILTGHGNVQLAVESIKLGAADFLEKPCSPAMLLQRLATYFAGWQERTVHNLGRREDFDFPELAGQSPPMLEVKELITRISRSDAPVLITGESGTGKELAARAIHRHSLRRRGPMVAVDCAAINDSILESELFGYEKGAFTGADRAAVGLIRSAGGGTLLLDEIGELPLTMQAKLLRTLQECQVRPVGATISQPVDIRVIAATNRRLESETSAGRFRSDLYYRISAITIEMPPLRQRRADIPLLVRHFLHLLGKEQPREMAADAMQLLLQYDWPGNVRELANVIRRAIALSATRVLNVSDLPASLTGSPGAVAQHAQSGDSLSSYERLALQNALQKTGNNKRRAAAILGIGEATLYRKLKQYGLSE